MCNKEPTTAEIRAWHKTLRIDNETTDFLRILLKRLEAAQKLTKQWRKPGASVWNECAKQMDKILGGEMKCH